MGYVVLPVSSVHMGMRVTTGLLIFNSNEFCLREDTDIGLMVMCSFASALPRRVLRVRNFLAIADLCFTLLPACHSHALAMPTAMSPFLPLIVITQRRDACYALQCGNIVCSNNHHQYMVSFVHRCRVLLCQRQFTELRQIQTTVDRRQKMREIAACSSLRLQFKDMQGMRFCELASGNWP